MRGAIQSTLAGHHYILFWFVLGLLVLGTDRESLADTVPSVKCTILTAGLRNAEITSSVTRLDANTILPKGTALVLAMVSIDHPQLRWAEITLNGESVTSLAPSNGRTIRDSIPLTLRPYNNQLRIFVQYGSSYLIKSYHIYRDVDDIGVSQRWVVLAASKGGPDLAATAGLSFVAERLTQGGVTKVTSLRDANITAIKKTLLKVRREMKSGDQLLFYYWCRASYDRQLREPRLITTESGPSNGKDVTTSLTDFFSYVGSLRIPSIAIILDIEPTQLDSQTELDSGNETTDAHTAALSDQAAFPWLAPLERQKNLELFMSYRFLGALTGTNVLRSFSFSLLRSWDQGSRAKTDCLSLRDLQAGMIEANESVADRPLYFATIHDKPAFCFTPAGGEVLRVEHSDVDQNGNTTLYPAVPTHDSARGLYVVTSNDVPVTAREVPPTNSGDLGLSERLWLPGGRSLVQVSVNKGRRRSLQGFTVIDNPKKEVDLLSPSEKVVPRIALIQPAGHTSTSVEENSTRREPARLLEINTSALALRLKFVVHDTSSTNTEYELQNNGIPVLFGSGRRSHKSDAFNIDINVPLTDGTNNLILRVGPPTRCNVLRLRVTYRRPQRVVGVIVGISGYGSSAVPLLKYCVDDAKLMRAVLLRSTDAQPTDILLLTGHAATGAALKAALSKDLGGMLRAQGSRMTDLALRDATLFFYFSGFGATEESNQRRCILPYDAKPENLSGTCISTTEIDKLLDDGPWKNAVVIFDTSYGGNSETSVPKEMERSSTPSRTLTEYFTQDEGWRVTSGLSSDRLLFVASGTNEAALEDAASGHGLLTAALTQSVDTFFTSTDPAFTVPLPDVLSYARDLVVKESQGRQNPILKGSLSESFVLKKFTSSDFRSQVVPVLASLRGDALLLKRPDSGQLDEVNRSVQKASELFPEETLPILLGAIAVRYETALCRTQRKPCDELLTIRQQELRELISKLQANTQMTAESRAVLYNAEMSLARLLKETGQTGEALALCEAALKLMPDSVVAMYTMVELLIQKLDFATAVPTLDKLLDLGWPNRKATAAALTPSEWGNIVIWRALALMSSGKGRQARLLLSIYGRRDLASTRFEWWLYGNRLAKSLFPSMYLRQDQGQVDDNATWHVLLANYLLGKRKESDLWKFRKDGVAQGELEADFIDCQIYFYIGIRALLKHDPSTASDYFAKVVVTDAKQYPEYWAARFELRSH